MATDKKGEPVRRSTKKEKKAWFEMIGRIKGARHL